MLANMDAILKAAGSSAAQVVKTTVSRVKESISVKLHVSLIDMDFLFRISYTGLPEEYV